MQDAERWRSMTVCLCERETENGGGTGPPWKLFTINAIFTEARVRREQIIQSMILLSWETSEGGHFRHQLKGTGPVNKWKRMRLIRAEKGHGRLNRYFNTKQIFFCNLIKQNSEISIQR